MEELEYDDHEDEGSIDLEQSLPAGIFKQQRVKLPGWNDQQGTDSTGKRDRGFPWQFPSDDDAPF